MTAEVLQLDSRAAGPKPERYVVAVPDDREATTLG